MKFLCVPCDRPLALEETRGPDRGSMTLVYACPDCGYEIAMLTNPHETQVVGSLGVTVGPAGRAGTGTGAAGSKCPFTGMVQERERAAATEPSRQPSPAGLDWTDEARERMERLPEFVRPMVAMGIERYARDRGYSLVDARVLDEARAQFEV